MEPSHPIGHPKPITPPRRRRKAQRESQDQKAWVKALNLKFQLGFFYRVKNMGTFDPVRGFFRKNQELVCIPDICGDMPGCAVYIECKYVQGVEKKKKLCFKAKISDGQKDFLYRAHKRGCRAGVAFTLDDAIAIAASDPKRHPRHPRTWCFLPPAEQEAKAEAWKAERAALSKLKNDPLGFIQLRDHGPEEDCT